jgi:hypothetical protein
MLSVSPILACRADVTVLMNRNDGEDASAGFGFEHVSAPSTNNLAVNGVFSVIEGEADTHGGGLKALTQRELPDEADQPRRNFFFDAGSAGGILQLDLGKILPVREINTYSWHVGSRAPQVYEVYGASGEGQGFVARPGSKTDFKNAGWTQIASVDTRVKFGGEGGQYGVSIQDAKVKLGDFRYLLFVCSATESNDAFGNTFYSRIDVLDHLETNRASVAPATFVARTADGKYEITINTSQAPEMKQWAETKLAPVLVEWYPKIVAYLPGKGYSAPQKVKVVIRPGRGVADTVNATIKAYTPWLKREQDRESAGALVHELVHVVQSYRWAKHKGKPKPNPGWLVEGLADYFRWYHFEPQSHGADIAPKNIKRSNYDGGYRVTANFLNWMSGAYGEKLIPELNAAMREGNYDADFWTAHTGKSVEQLGAEWKESLERSTGSAAK